MGNELNHARDHQQPRPDDVVHIVLAGLPGLLADGLALGLQSMGHASSTVGDDLGDIVAATGARSLVLLQVGVSVGAEHVAALFTAGLPVLLLCDDSYSLSTLACFEAGAAGVIELSQPLHDLVATLEKFATTGVAMDEEERLRLTSELRIQRREREEQLRPFSRLTPRERGVLHSLMGGMTADEIAEHGYVSIHTVRSQIRAVLMKLGVRSQLAAVGMALDVGWENE